MVLLLSIEYELDDFKFLLDLVFLKYPGKGKFSGAVHLHF